MTVQPLGLIVMSACVCGDPPPPALSGDRQAEHGYGVFFFLPTVSPGAWSGRLSGDRFGEFVEASGQSGVRCLLR